MIPRPTGFLLKEDGHVIHRLDLLCPDDEAAKVRAKQLVDGHDVELWERARHIATAGPDSPIAQWSGSIGRMHSPLPPR
jgi:hypothetical protein